MISEIETTRKFIKDKGIKSPDIGIILGTGLRSLVDEIEIEISLDYK